jgi:hypothetical protein
MLDLWRNSAAGLLIGRQMIALVVKGKGDVSVRKVTAIHGVVSW